MKGNVKIELFDAVTGEKDEEAVSKNFISKGVASVFQAKMRSMILSKVGTALNYNLGFLEEPTNVLFLSESDMPEQPDNEWVVPGNIIGEASAQGAVSSDPKIGVLNIGESEITLTKLKMVFDFSTNKANGVFRSVGTKSAYEKKAPGEKTSIIAATEVFGLHGDYLFHKGGYQEIVRTNIITKEKKSITTPYRSVTVKDGYLLVSNSVENYHKYDVNSFDINSKIVIETPTTKVYAINSDEKGNFYFSKTFADGSTVFKSINEDLSDAEETIYRTKGSSILFLSQGERLVNLASESSAFLDDEIANISFDYPAFGVVESLTPGYMYLVYSTTVYHVPKISLGSRALLSQPITKTDKQTMKITYEFTLPPLY